MHRFVAILLIPIFVVGNSFAHSHGQSVHSTEAHGRAHIHVGNASQHDARHESHSRAHGHSHHGHHQHSHHENQGRDESGSPPVEVLVDHDSDAIYLVSADLAMNCSDRTSPEVDAPALVHTRDFLFVDMPAKIQHPQMDESPPPQRPLFLLHAALRL